MAKKKDSVALFEVIQKARKNQANMDVPEWMGGPKPADTGGQPAAAVRQPAAEPTAGPWRVVSIEGDRLRLSLNYGACAAVVAGLVLLLAGAFALGYWAGAPGGGGAGPLAGDANGPLKDRTPLGAHVLGKAGKPAGGGGVGSAAASAQRTPGKRYLVIQTLRGNTPADRREADRIAAWCTAQGEPATVGVWQKQNRLLVWSLKPFDFPSGRPTEEALAYARKIQTLGKRYFAQYKTYDFRQTTRDGKFDPWFELYR